MLFFLINIKKSQSKLSKEPLKVPQTELSDFYMTNPISKASITMAKCVKSFEQRKNASKNQQQQQAV